MRKFINWASIAFVCLFVYAILSNYFLVIQSLPFGEWDLFPSLAAISVAISGYKLVESKKFIKLIDNGEIKYFPAVMAALEATDKDIYNVIIRDYRNHVSKKIDDLSAYIEDEKCRCFDEFKSKGMTSFNVKDETTQLYNYKTMRDTLLKIQRGEMSWEDVYQNFIHFCKMNYTVKYLLGELSEEENNKILKEVETIKELRNGGNKVII